MPDGSFKQVDVQCPFYKRDDARRILVCEGFVDNSALQWNFSCRKDLNQQMDLFCCDHYKNCEVYRMLMDSKY